MTDHSGTEPGTTHTRAGVLYAVLAAAAAGLLLLLPVLLLGITFDALVDVMTGEIVAWRGSLDMTYAFIGPLALLALLLLFIPLALFRAAGRRLGTWRAIWWVGGLLVAWHGGVALLWARQAMAGSTPASERPEIWYAVAFGIAAVVILIATVVAERRAVRAAVALAGGLAVALVALVAVLVAFWGSPPRIAAGAQTVHVVVTASEVRLDPATVHAGDVYFVVEAPYDPTTGASFYFEFVHRGYGSHCCDTRLPLSDDEVARLARGDYQDTSSEGGWAKYARFTLHEGKYAFLITLPGGGPVDDVPPQSIAVLEVVP